LERMRQEFLGRTAEEYRDSDYYRRKLREGLRNMADTAREMAQSGSNGLVDQFGQMGRRRFHMADIPSNSETEDEAADDAGTSSDPDQFEVGAAGAVSVVDEEPALAAAVA